MNSHSPSPPPQPSPRPPHTPQPSAHHVVHIRAKPGGVWSALAFIAVVALFVIAFIVGITIGAAGMFATRAADTVMLEHTYRSGTRDKIAILPIDGIITEPQAEFARAAVDHILRDRHVKAVILRVNSPGGGVTASDQIWYEIERLKANNLPVVASYGSLAASGGYYISCGADHIIAEETTITGSIGVIAQIFTLHELADKIGVQPITLVASHSPRKDVGNNPFRPWDEQDQLVWLNLLDHAHDVFRRRVADGRASVLGDEEQVMAIADGSIFPGTEAMEVGLVDAIGYLDDAVAEAERRAGIAAGRAHVVKIAAPPSLAELLFGGPAAGANLNADSLRAFVNDLSTPRMMYLMW